MKKLLFIVLFMVIIVPPVLAATPTTTPTDSKNDTMEAQITNLKDRVASRVAQLKLVEKRAFTGKVTDVSSTQITIKNFQNETRVIDVDEITKFTSDDKKAQDGFGISDIKKEMNITALGLYNKESNHLLARYISVVSSPIFIFGKVTNIDKKEYTMTVTSPDNKSMIVDIETTTKTVNYSNNTFSKVGFSKVTVDDQVAVIGYPNNKGDNRMQGGRIMIINSLPQTTAPSSKPASS